MTTSHQLADLINTWRINYGLDTRTPDEAVEYWRGQYSVPTGVIFALATAIGAIESLTAELAAFRAQQEQEPAIVQRVKDLHDKAGMPWDQAQELALSEAGIDDKALAEVIGESGGGGGYIITDDEVKAFARGVMVWGASWLAHPSPNWSAMASEKE